MNESGNGPLCGLGTASRECVCVEKEPKVATSLFRFKRSGDRDIEKMA